jgi:hypothetical protein
VVDFMVENWAEVGFGMGATVDFIIPREMAV